MTETLDRKRIIIFLLFAFGIAWAAGLVIYLTGGLLHSPKLGGNLTLALVLIASAYAWAPALAHLLTRLITREGRRGLFLWPRIRRGWPFWLAAWFVPGIAVIAGCALFFALYPGYFDPTLAALHRLMAGNPQAAKLGPWLVAGLQAAQAFLIAPIVNAPATFGEEFGWRAYLLPKVMPLGGRRATLIIGIVWGAWHWPLIAMGYEYSFNYPFFPWLGFLAFVWFTILFATFQSWVTLRSGSDWPAVIAHGALNGMAGLPTLFVLTAQPWLLGPGINGLVGSVPLLLLVLLLFFSRGALAPMASAQPEDGPREAPAVTEGSVQA